MTRRERFFVGFGLVLPMAWLGPAAPARADDACAAAYEESQVARSDGRLRAAQRELGACTRAECAEFIRIDCARWLAEVEAAQPTIVLRATDGAEDVTDVAVDLDGEPLATELDGKAVVVEPGRHVLTLRRGKHEPVRVTLVFREGEKNHPVSVALTPPAPIPAQPTPVPAPVARGVGPWPWVLLGVGAAGAAGFGVFGAFGAQQRHELERSCSPRCSEERIDEVRSKFLLADVSAAVGLLAFAGAGYLFWTGTRDDAAAGPSARPRAAGLFLTGQGVSGAARWSF